MTAIAGGPVAAADITGLIGLTSQKPLVRLIASGTQSIANNSATAVTFSGSEDIDTNNFHDPSTNPSRVTPNVAGTYNVRATLVMGGRTDYQVVDCWIRKNGSSNLAPSGRQSAGTTTSQATSADTRLLVPFNGTSDYIELMAFQVNAAAAAQLTNQSSQFSSVLELILERSPS